MSTRYRRNTRHPAKMKVTVRVGGRGRAYEGHAGDVSKSGIFVVMEETLAEGKRVDMMIELPGQEQPIPTSGIVVHTFKGFGVGIKFTGQTQRAQEQIERLLLKIKQATQRDAMARRMELRADPGPTRK